MQLAKQTHEDKQTYLVQCAGRPHHSNRIHGLRRIPVVGSQCKLRDYLDCRRQAVNKLDILFVQNAKSVTLNKGKLVLRGVNPVTVCFTDRPARLARHKTTSKFVPLWSQGKDSFLRDNPNATLSVFHGDKVSDLVVELSNPQLSGNDLSYDVKVLEGTLLAKGEPARCSSISLACRERPILSLVAHGASTVATGN